MYHQCPICQNSLSEEEVFHQSEEKDFVCHKENHFFGARLKDNKPIALKLRLTDGKDKLYLRINYEANYSSIWTKADEPRPIKVPGVISSDFSDLDKIKRKIKTYLLFS